MSANERYFDKKHAIVFRKTQCKNVYRRTIEIPQRTRIFKANYCLKVHNAHIKLASPIYRKIVKNSIVILETKAH